MFICADGGANTAVEFGKIPDVIIGDFDSVTPATLKACHSAQLIRLEDQETTDFEKVLTYLGQWPDAQVTVWGALGLRIDHTIGNLSSLIRLAGTRSVFLKSNNALSYSIPSGFNKSFPPGKIISLIPIPSAREVSTSGLRWPLINETIELGSRNGTLNQATGGPVCITFTSGHLILMEIDG